MIALTMLWKYRRIGIYIVAALALVAALATVNGWRTAAGQKAAAVEQFHTEQRAHSETIARHEKQLQDSQAARQKLAAELESVRQRFEARPPVIPKTLVKIVEVPIAPDQTACPDPRLSSDFMRLWNDTAAP
jgi:hypothetical protein